LYVRTQAAITVHTQHTDNTHICARHTDNTMITNKESHSYVNPITNCISYINFGQWSTCTQLTRLGVFIIWRAIKYMPTYIQDRRTRTFCT